MISFYRTCKQHGVPRYYVTGDNPRLVSEHMFSADTPEVFLSEQHLYAYGLLAVFSGGIVYSLSSPRSEETFCATWDGSQFAIASMPISSSDFLACCNTDKVVQASLAHSLLHIMPEKMSNALLSLLALSWPHGGPDQIPIPECLADAYLVRRAETP